ncbi:hypothetical protein [Actibacterium pelagium]|nr:hypothetical protein [Actibacterium pelagium]
MKNTVALNGQSHPFGLVEIEIEKIWKSYNHKRAWQMIEKSITDMDSKIDGTSGRSYKPLYEKPEISLEIDGFEPFWREAMEKAFWLFLYGLTVVLGAMSVLLIADMI